MTDIAWMTVFIDMPGVGFDASLAFWSWATGFTPSEARGDEGQYRSLRGADADVHLRLQRVGADRPGVHIDLHVASVATAAERAVALGAEAVADITDENGRFIVVRSPAGLLSCFVDHRGEHRVAAPGGPGPSPVTVDQVSIDVPADRYQVEVEYWAALTGFEAKTGELDEFTVLRHRRELPFRLLLQRLGADNDQSGKAQARAHLDLSAGADNAAVAEAHSAQGAEIVAVFTYWTVMRDPAGMIYCLTRRHPETGEHPS